MLSLFFAVLILFFLSFVNFTECFDVTKRVFDFSFRNDPLNWLETQANKFYFISKAHLDSIFNATSINYDFERKSSQIENQSRCG
jgi:hypothetical protein